MDDFSDLGTLPPVPRDLPTAVKEYLRGPVSPDADKRAIALVSSLAARHPVIRLSDGLAVVASSAAAEAALSDPRFVVGSARGLPPMPLTGFPELAALLDTTLPLLTEADHLRLRRVLGPHFARSSAEAMRSGIAAMIAARWPSPGATGQFDLVGDFTDPLPVMISRQLMGLPGSDDPRLLAWARMLRDQLGRFGQDNATLTAARAALNELRDYAVSALRAPQPGALESVAKGVRAGVIDSREALGLFVLLLLNGLETLSQALVHVVRIIGGSEQWLAKIRADSGCAHHAFRMTLLASPPLRMLARRARCPVSIAGSQLDPGAVVVIMLPAVTRAAAQVRPDGRALANLAYGFGPHICLGMHVADVAGAELSLFLARRYRRVDALAGAVPHPSPAINGYLRFPVCPLPLPTAATADRVIDDHRTEF